MRAIPPRLRTPAILATVALIAIVVAGATHGWKALIALPIPLAVGSFYYTMAGREGDYSALLRFELDERQTFAHLKVWALVGRVLGAAAVVAYIAAIATKSTVWPWGVLLGLLVSSLVGGHLAFSERTDSPDEDPHEVPGTS